MKNGNGETIKIIMSGATKVHMEMWHLLYRVRRQADESLDFDV